MADVAINTSLWTGHEVLSDQNAVVWKTPLIGYVWLIPSGNALAIYKTTDGGANWSLAATMNTATITRYSVWAKEWTTANTSDTLVHVWYLDFASAGNGILHYRSFDMFDDSMGTERTIVGSLTSATGTGQGSVSGIETRGGNLAVAMRADAASTNDDFYTSLDAGVNWVDEASPWDGVDMCQLMPGTETDTDDLWFIYVDASDTSLRMKVYDNSGNTWGAADTIDATVTPNFAGAVNLGAAHRQSDNHAIVAYWNAFDNVGDLRVVDVAASASYSQKTNIIDNTSEALECAVFINQQNDDIYVGYLSGTTWGSLLDCHYQKSSNGGTTWGGEASMSVDTEDDLRGMWGGNGVGDNGGMFSLIWQNEDLADMFTNADNAVSIAAAAGGRIMASLVGAGGLAGAGGIAGRGGGLAG